MYLWCSVHFSSCKLWDISCKSSRKIVTLQWYNCCVDNVHWVKLHIAFSFCHFVSTDINVVVKHVLYLECNNLLDMLCLVFQLIAAYSPPPAPPAPPPEAPDFAYESASTRLDFKDSDMKRLSMEIERERWVEIPCGDAFKDSLYWLVYIL